MKNSTPLLDEDILRAAEILKQDAQDIKASHTIRGRWTSTDPIDVSAKAHYDECSRISRRLRRMVGTF
jgi:hypothetical protein